MSRALYSARLDHKTCISEPSQCYHLRFTLSDENGELPGFPFSAGQFVSVVATDPGGKQQTRAYSIASAPDGNRLDLCVNRVEDGFFSNYLTGLAQDASVTLHGPYGYFVLQQPVTDSIFVAAGTGIAPIRGFTQWLFPKDGPDRSESKDIWLIYATGQEGTGHESDLYYHEEFEALAARKTNFHYLPIRGNIQQHVAKIVEERAARLGISLPAAPVDPSIPRAELRFDIYAYICGLNEMVAGVREKLAGYGWHRKQIIFERYD